jgi:uncharacterized protein YciI
MAQTILRDSQCTGTTEDALSGTTEETPQEWWVLQHRPGSAIADGESVFDHPDFAEHVAFLHRLDEAGLLVAAGPLPDEAGAGMTVIRTSGHPDAAEVRRLATEDDLSVARGVLSVRVRAWRVLLAG